MRELTVVQDSVFLSYLMSCLRAEGIEATVLDRHTSAALGGAVSAIRARVWVEAARYDRARWVLATAADPDEQP
jgi:hypothetical protein